MYQITLLFLYLTFSSLLSFFFSFFLSFFLSLHNSLLLFVSFSFNVLWEWVLQRRCFSFSGSSRRLMLPFRVPLDRHHLSSRKKKNWTKNKLSRKEERKTKRKINKRRQWNATGRWWMSRNKQTWKEFEKNDDLWKKSLEARMASQIFWLIILKLYKSDSIICLFSSCCWIKLNLKWKFNLFQMNDLLKLTFCVEHFIGGEKYRSTS